MLCGCVLVVDEVQIQIQLKRCSKRSSLSQQSQLEAGCRELVRGWKGARLGNCPVRCDTSVRVGWVENHLDRFAEKWTRFLRRL